MMLMSIWMFAALAKEPTPPATWVNRWYDGTATHHVVADAPYVFRGRIEAYGFPEDRWWTASGQQQGPAYSPAFTATMRELGRETRAHSPT